MAISSRKVADLFKRHFNVTVVTCPVSRCECICINHPPHHNSQNNDVQQMGGGGGGWARLNTSLQVAI